MLKAGGGAPPRRPEAVEFVPPAAKQTEKFYNPQSVTDVLREFSGGPLHSGSVDLWVVVGTPVDEVVVCVWVGDEFELVTGRDRGGGEDARSPGETAIVVGVRLPGEH